MHVPPLTAPALPGSTFSRQRWSDVVFVHWAVPSASVAHLFPRGTRPDEVAPGVTYVGLVPFRMSDVSLVVPISPPYFGTFLETNVRLYSIDDAGRQGVVFLSMESERLGIVPITRAMLGFPYTWARMRARRTGDRLEYDSIRRLPSAGLRNRVSVEIGGEADATELDVWLTARWGAHTRHLGQTWWVPNAHGTWQLHEAQLRELDTQLVDGLVERVPVPAIVRFSPGVTAEFGWPVRVG